MDEGYHLQCKVKVIAVASDISPSAAVSRISLDRDRLMAGGRLAKGMCDVWSGVILEWEASHAIPSHLFSIPVLETEVLLESCVVWRGKNTRSPDNHFCYSMTSLEVVLWWLDSIRLLAGFPNCSGWSEQRNAML